MVHSPHEMSKVLNGNGNGNSTQSLIRQIEKKAVRAKVAALPHAIKESGVTFQTEESVELHGALSRVTRHTVVFELYNPGVTLRLSEVLAGFEIIFQERAVYSGRATVCNAVNAGTKIVYEATLKEEDWTDLSPEMAPLSDDGLAKEFKSFLKEWQKFYKVSPEFKVVIADMQTFLHGLRQWLGQIELRIHSASDKDSLPLKKEIGLKIGKNTSAALTKMFEKFEDICRRADPDILGAYGAFAKHMLHPFLLCSPFLSRTYHKPLGYAGDYEMVNMILRDPLEGESLFAKIVNLWFWEQPPAEAHRNRIKYLVNILDETTLRMMKVGKTPRILSIGCGPAVEVQQFMASRHFADQAHFTLLDFNQTTLDYARAVMEAIKGRYSRNTHLEFVRKSVDGILRERSRTATQADNQYDLVYCAGLFDYLTDPVCQRLMEILYNSVRPNGLLVSTNVSDSNPRTPTMEHIMDWHLIYRSAHDLAKLRPTQASAGEWVVKADDTGVNIFMEVRKPLHE
jgi:extracellular factor (EF) 3-hydroxypalmitic acid methyl ester biosynthesis protein